ncbi:zinc-ribbon domain-containing protein [Mailhella massiliensis]|uniref:zinc-ribbon domain-containing protein n=1 Tax=Bacteria TaxID=2 RepID=UPI00118707D8
MFCNNCGVEVPDGKRYCNNCGKKLDVKGSSERVEKRKSKCINHNRIKNNLTV